VSNFGISDDQKYIMINYLNALLKIENGITNNPLSNEKRKNIIELLAKQKCKTELRNHIESVQKKTQLLLTTIQESDDFYNTNIFKSVMVRYNSLLQSKIIVSKRYGLKTVTLPFGGKPMEELLLEKIKDTHGQYQNALRATYLSECVCYCFLEYLRQPGNYSGQRIKKCPYCNHYFIAKDSKRKRCYLESCSKEYEKEKKRKQRNDEPEFYA